MSGQDGMRGYLIQSIIAVLASLKDEDWMEICVEPDIGNDKVDVLWKYPNKEKVWQIKSSQNQITPSAIATWANELKSNYTSAGERELQIIGPINKDVKADDDCNGVKILQPLPLSIEALVGHACNELDAYLEKLTIHKVPVLARELIIESLVSKISIFSTSGRRVSRTDFTKIIKDELLLILPTSIVDSVESLKQKYERETKIEETKYQMKHDACIEALSIIDDFFLRSIKDEIYSKIKMEAKIPSPLEFGERARRCHNRLVLSCDNKDVINLFRYILMDYEDKPPITMDIIVDFRAVVRKELDFGDTSVDDDRKRCWIGTL